MKREIICPKCRHVRPTDATNPEWQCPACGICYAKVGATAEPLPASRTRAAPASVGKHDWNLGLVAKVVAVVALGWGLSTVIKHRQQPAGSAGVEVAEAEQKPDAGSAVADAVLQVSGADAGMLRDVGGKMEKSCARNKYGLSEAECIDRIRKRGDLCANQTAARFPGQIGNTDRMQAVVQDYVGCIFER